MEECERKGGVKIIEDMVQLYLGGSIVSNRGTESFYFVDLLQLLQQYMLCESIMILRASTGDSPFLAVIRLLGRTFQVGEIKHEICFERNQ